MPIYVFQYTTDAGKTKQVEEMMAMGMLDKYPTIEVIDEDGKTYVATRIMAVTADMKKAWNYDTDTSDLPPVDSPELGFD